MSVEETSHIPSGEKRPFRGTTFSPFSRQPSGIKLRTCLSAPKVLTQKHPEAVLLTGRESGFSMPQNALRIEALSIYLTRSIIKVSRLLLSTKQLLLTHDLLQCAQRHVTRRTVGVIPIPSEERREATKRVSVWSTDHRLITLLKMQISCPHCIGRWNSIPQ